MMKSSILLILLLLASKGLIGQNKLLIEEFKGIYSKYQNIPEYELVFSVKYLDNTSKVAVEQKGKVVHSEKLHYVNFNGMITLIRGNEFINANSSSNVLVYNKRKKSKSIKPEAGFDISSTIDSLYANQSNFKYEVISSVKNLRTIYITDMKDRNYRGYEVTYNFKTFRLLKYKYLIRAEIKNMYSAVEINYISENLKPNTSAKIYKPSYYIQGTGQSIKPSGTYSSYQFINQIKSEKGYEN